MPTNGMTIDSLNTVSALTEQDKVPVWDNESSGEPTRKITAQNMANSVKTLGNLVNTTEMNDAIVQSMAHTQMGNLFSQAKSSVTITYQNATKSGNRIYFIIKATLPATGYAGEWLIYISQNGMPYDMSYFPAINTNGGAYIFYASNSGIIANDEAYPAGTYIISGSYAA